MMGIGSPPDDPPWKDWPEAGPDDWEPCPKCGNMDGGCPFCGHGMVPKLGFQWPKPGGLS